MNESGQPAATTRHALKGVVRVTTTGGETYTGEVDYTDTVGVSLNVFSESGEAKFTRLFPWQSVAYVDRLAKAGR